MCFGTEGGFRSPTTAFCWIADSSLEVFKRGEAERLSELLSWFLATSGLARSESPLFYVFLTFQAVFRFEVFVTLVTLEIFCLHRVSHIFKCRLLSGGQRSFARNSANFEGEAGDLPPAGQRLAEILTLQ